MFNPTLYFAYNIFLTERSKRASSIRPSLKAFIISCCAFGILSEINNTSFPAKKAAKSISPGFLKLEAPFIFNASVKTKPLNSKSFCNKLVTMFLDKEEGKLALSSNEGTFK